jgi:AcrR family transcriptional regulator
MDSSHATPERATPDTGRRDLVLESALGTFARFGYRKTSMEDVARDAHISRPGLYFLFSSKQDLFRAAVTRALERDLSAAEECLATSERSLPDRLAAAFDYWAGGYVGAGGREMAAVIDENPDLVGTIVETAPRRFEAIITDALCHVTGKREARAITQTLISTSIGLKYQVDTRVAYQKRIATAINLLVG